VGVGWDSALLGLAGHLTSDPEAIDPAQAMAWAESEEGRRFMTLSSEHWCEANIAAGADEAWARRGRPDDGRLHRPAAAHRLSIDPRTCGRASA
jgi:hypothetical protein